MKKRKSKNLQRKLKIISTCIKVTVKKTISYANEHKIVYAIAGTTLAAIIAIIILLIFTGNKTTTEPQYIEETIQVGVDDDGEPIYETKKVLVTSSPESPDEPVEDPVVLAYKEDAKNGYMNNCIFLGDSRTVAAVSYGFLNDDMVLAQIGISHTSVATNTFVQNSGREYTLESYLKSHQSPVVYINYGVNGMNGISEEKYESTYEALIDQIISLCPNSKIVLMGIWPVDDYGTYKGRVKNEWIDKYNAWLLQIAEKKGLHYLDVETILKGSDGQILAKYDAGDGLHYRSSAYNDIIDYIIHHPVPGISDDGEFIVHYVAPSGDYKKIMKETPTLPDNVVKETPTPTPHPTVEVKCEHQFGKWIIEKEASTVAEGSKYRECELCGYREYNTIDIIINTPTGKQTPTPTPTPTPEPTDTPEVQPTVAPTEAPSDEPTPEPTDEPVPEPTDEPAPTPEPTDEPVPETVISENI